MKIGFIGLGKMGGNMALRLLEDGHSVVGYDPDETSMNKAAKTGVLPSNNYSDLVNQLESPAIIWLMVPAGEITGKVIDEISDKLKPDDILIDGGNSFYKDTIERAENLKKRKIHFIDVGTSGGILGLEAGYCLMVGGEEKAYKKIEPILRSLAPERGYDYMGSSGSGHFVKMVHNGIEYAMLQSYGEGFAILEAKKEFDLDFRKIAGLWNNGSIIKSLLLELAEDLFKEKPKLESIKGYVQDTGEGRWTVQEAIDLDIPAPAITISLLERFQSRLPDSFSAKLIAGLRKQFGGHSVRKNN
jgi:6-phosphogluconate dehydrogenase